jgi:hypothetical protein
MILRSKGLTRKKQAPVITAPGQPLSSIHHLLRMTKTCLLELDCSIEETDAVFNHPSCSAIGVSGSTVENDRAVALAGATISALGSCRNDAAVSACRLLRIAIRASTLWFSSFLRPHLVRKTSSGERRVGGAFLF